MMPHELRKGASCGEMKPMRSCARAPSAGFGGRVGSYCNGFAWHEVEARRLQRQGFTRDRISHFRPGHSRQVSVLAPPAEDQS